MILLSEEDPWKNRCPDNPNRGKRCKNCGKQVIMFQCWSRKKKKNDGSEQKNKASIVFAENEKLSNVQANDGEVFEEEQSESDSDKKRGRDRGCRACS